MLAQSTVEGNIENLTNHAITAILYAKIKHQQRRYLFIQCSVSFHVACIICPNFFKPFTRIPVILELMDDLLV